MKAAKIILPIGILVACLGAAFLLVGSQGSLADASTSQPPPAVRVATVEALDWTVELEARGLVEARDAVVISAQVRAQVVEVSPRLEVGVDIEAGEWLLSLDPSDFELALERRQALVAQARLELRRQRLELEVAAAEWGEDGSLGDGPIALREQEVAAAEAALDAALADAAQARLDLDRCRLLAPRAGRVHRRSVSVGEYAGPGEELASLWLLDRAEVRLPIPADEVQWLPDLGAGEPPPVLVRPYEDRGDARWGTLIRREGEIDRRDRVLHVVASLDAPFDAGQPDPMDIGSFVEVLIPGQRLVGAMPIPRSSLRGADRVLVVEDGRLRSRAVTVARTEGDTAFVTDGLTPGEQICLTPLELFVEDMAVVPDVVDLPMPRPRLPAERPIAEDDRDAVATTADPEGSESGSAPLSQLATTEVDPAPTFQLGAITVEDHGSELRVHFEIDSRAPRNSFALDAPPRFVVDFGATRLATRSRGQAIGAFGVDRLRLAEHAERGVTRVVFDLSEPTAPTWEASDDGWTLRFDRGADER